MVLSLIHIWVKPRQLGTFKVFFPLQPHRAAGAGLKPCQDGLGGGIALSLIHISGDLHLGLLQLAHKLTDINSQRQETEMEIVRAAQELLDAEPERCV